MDHDTRKTFREIHGTPSAFVAELERIERFALPRFQTPRDSAHPIELRFLTPLDPQPKGSGPETVHLLLTAPSEHKGQDYVAVSYTWKQADSLIDAFGSSIPKYTIWDSGSESRHPRCDPIVLHRAYRFARTRLKRVLLWIDQECITQDDPEDVETHLQAMHEIYRRSAFTVVLLSSMIDTVHVAAGLFPFLQGRDEVLDEILLNDDCRTRKQCVVALYHLAQDRWFTRTWTYQERFFASVCQYLVPLSPALMVDADTSKAADLVDWCIPERHLVTFDEKIYSYGVHGRGHLKLYFHSFFNDKGCSSCRGYMMDVKQLVKFSFSASRSNNYKIHLPGFEEFGVNSIKGVSNACKILKQEYTAVEQGRDSMMGRFETVNAVFTAMEACDNAVVSDRISIFANICQFEWTMQTVRLREEKSSYSTCVLVLLLLDVLKQNDSDTKMILAEKVMDMTIIDYIRSQTFPYSRAMYKWNARYPSYA